jgi:hypothetical protein
MRIIHITQQHKLPFGMKPTSECVESTVQSQFKVAHEIKKHPEYPVLEEGLYENASEAKAYPFSGIVKMIFPDGFPNTYSDLTKLQKEFLYEEGAVRTLFYLGDIKSIYKSIHKDASDTVSKEISEGKYEHVFMPRELEAIECAKEAALENFRNLDDASIFLVYGGGHDFKPHCDRERFDYEKVDTVSSTRPAKKFTGLTAVQETMYPIKNQNITIPKSLQEALSDGGVNDYLHRGHATMEQLISINEKTPYVIGALRCSNIRKGIYKRYIEIDQLSKLTEEQIHSIEHKFKDATLQSKVEEYVKSNQNRL